MNFPRARILATVSRIAMKFSPASRTVVAAAVLVYLFANAATKPVFLFPPPADEVTWADRSLVPWWFPHPRIISAEVEPGGRLCEPYYYAIHHPTVTRIVYRLVLDAAGIHERPTMRFDYSLTYKENMDLGNFLGYQTRTPLRITNAVFVLAALVLMLLAFLRICRSRLLVLLALVPIMYEPTLVGALNSTVGYIGTDAILLFMLVLFWYVWLLVKDRGLGGVVLLGLLAGLAVSTKYNAVFALIAAMIYYAFRGRGRQRVVWPLLMGLVATVVFFGLNPVYHGGGLRWAGKVLHDTIWVHWKMQGDAAMTAGYLSGRGELVLACFPYAPFLLPVVCALVKVGRARWFWPTVLWSLLIIAGNVFGIRVFLPTYAAPVRVAFLVLLMSAGLAKVAELTDGNRARARDAPSPGGAAGQAPPASQRPKNGRPPSGPLRKRRIPAALALLPVIAAFGFLSDITPTLLFLAALMVVLFAGARIITPSTLAAALVVAPLALTVHWRSAPAAYHMVRFVLAGATLWVLWLWLARRDGDRHNSTVAAFASTIAFAVSPHSMVLLAIVALAYWFRRRGADRPRVLAAVLLGPILVLYFKWLAAKVLGTWTPFLPEWSQLTWTLRALWNEAAWAQAAHTTPYNKAVIRFGKQFYWPLIAVLPLFALNRRRAWWFATTFAGGALLVAGTLAWGGDVHFQYSLPMQVGLVVPLSIAAVEGLGGTGMGGLGRLTRRLSEGLAVLAGRFRRASEKNGGG